jgi:D-arabinose 1-dehydrogenase-like Zn-dependent alcohol dehydrogenase
MRPATSCQGRLCTDDSEQLYPQRERVAGSLISNLVDMWGMLEFCAAHRIDPGI